MDSTQWYVAVDGNTVGPVSTELLMRGLSGGKVPVDALVCAVGDAEWLAVTAAPPFSYELFGAERPAPESEPVTDSSAAPFSADPFARARAVAPSIAQPGLNGRGSSPALEAPLPGTLEDQDLDGGLDVDIVFDTFDDETKPRYFNWARPISPYFQPTDGIELPHEGLLIGSLPTTPASVLTQEEGMWNVALCLAFGSRSLADAVASRFFEAVGEVGDPRKVEWMTLTLLSRGFMPSGIPKDNGQSGFAALARQCPPELEDHLV